MRRSSPAAIRPTYERCPRCAGAGRIQVYTGADLRAAREACDPPVSIRELARRSGMSAAYLSDVELGRRKVTERTLTIYNHLAASSSLRQLTP